MLFGIISSCIIIGLVWDFYLLNKKLSKINIQPFNQKELDDYCYNKWLNRNYNNKN